MRNLLLASILLLACCLGFNSQLKAQATNATCQNALMIGAINPSYPLPVNQPSAPAGNNYNCLGSQPNPLWFYFQLNTAGSLELLLSNTANVDVDFILYGPFASANAALAGCGNLGNGGSGASVVDCSYSTAANELVNVNNGNAGDFYLLLVTNFSNSPTTGNTQIVLGGNSTATMVNPYVGAPVITGTCSNAINGSISTNVTNGTAPYTYVWSNGATTSGISGLSAGFYSFTVTDATGATFANNSINVPTTSAIRVNIANSICTGDSAFIYGQWRYAQGVYYDTVTNSAGCDTIFGTTLNINQFSGYRDIELCVGDSIFVGGAWQYTSGYYTDTIVNPSGCDSIIDIYYDFYICSPVWAGDADDNLIVDGDDWLQLGLANGLWGNIRANASINWVAQPAIDWGSNVGMAEAKHADCNGDGQVDGGDSLAIIQNYSLTHLRTANSTVNSGADVQLVPQQATYNVGDLVKIDVVLGNNTTAFTDAYGYFFKIDVGNIFRAGSLQFTPTNSFLGTNADVWTLSKELAASNQIDIAQVRHNQMGMNGFGKVGEISFILSNNAGNTSPVLGFVSDKIINSSNIVIPVTTSAATFNVNPTSVQNNVNYNFAAKVVPNPVQNQAYLEFELAENSPETQIRVINSLGQVQHNQVLNPLNAGTHRVELQTNLAAGTYFVEIRNQNQTARVPFVKVQ